MHQHRLQRRVCVAAPGAVEQLQHAGQLVAGQPTANRFAERFVTGDLFNARARLVEVAQQIVAVAVDRFEHRHATGHVLEKLAEAAFAGSQFQGARCHQRLEVLVTLPHRGRHPVEGVSDHADLVLVGHRYLDRQIAQVNLADAGCQRPQRSDKQDVVEQREEQQGQQAGDNQQVGQRQQLLVKFHLALVAGGRHHAIRAGQLVAVLAGQIQNGDVLAVVAALKSGLPRS